MKPWTITVDGASWTDADAKVAHVAILSELLGLSSWDALSPWSSPTILAGWLAVLTATSTGKTLDECMQAVQLMPLAEFGACLAERDDDGAGE